MTDEEKMELEALRAEKHDREQTERARAALGAAGVSAGFAALLVGTETRTPTAACRISARRISPP